MTSHEITSESSDQFLVARRGESRRDIFNYSNERYRIKDDLGGEAGTLPNALIASEIETTAGKQHHESAISPINYTLDLLGEQQMGPTTASSRRPLPNGKIGIYSKAKYGLTRRITRLSGLKAILQRSFLFRSKRRTLCANTRRSTTSGFRKEI
jgi:hypothetical protein